MASSSGPGEEELVGEDVGLDVLPGRLVVALGLDAQELLLVVPLVQRLGLVEPLVALQADEAGAQDLGHRLGQLGLAGAGRALDQDRLAEAVGEEHDARDRIVGEVVDVLQPGADGRGRIEAGVHPVDVTGSRLPVPSPLSHRTRPLPHLPPVLVVIPCTGDAESPPERRAAGQPRVWPVPRTMYLAQVSSRRPMGPRAWSFWVRDADLGAEAELLAVDEAGRGVDHHRGRVDLGGETVGRLDRPGDDRLGVARAVAGDVVDGLVERRRRP